MRSSKDMRKPEGGLQTIQEDSALNGTARFGGGINDQSTTL